MLSGSLASGSSNSLSSDGLTLFAPFIFAGFFITFFQLEPLEKAIVLNLFFQYTHGLFQIVIKNLDLNFLHLFRPLLYHPISCVRYRCGSFHIHLFTNIQKTIFFQENSNKKTVGNSEKSEGTENSENLQFGNQLVGNFVDTGFSIQRNVANAFSGSSLIPEIIGRGQCAV